MKFALILCFILACLIAACDPLAPEITQEVIVVTSTPSPFSQGSARGSITPVLSNPIPTRTTPTITPTPTLAVIPTPTVPPCDQTEGSLFDSTFNSAITGTDISYNIYLPPCFFQSGRRYPLLILLHDSGDTYTQWADLGIQEALDSGINDKTLAPAVVVMPDGGSSLESSNFVEGVSFENIILDEFVPHLEASFCLMTGRAGHAIGGIARGGFWAFSIAFRHPELFSIVGAHSPVLAPDNAPADHNPLSLAESTPALQNVRIYFDTSQSDSVAANAIVLSNVLSNRGIPHNYVINAAGSRDNDYWEAHLTDYLSFYSASWPKDVAGYPSCQS